MNRRHTKIAPYGGQNETINRLREPDEELWVVNGEAGRRVVILPPGSTEDDAWAEYERRFDEKVKQ